MNKIISGLLIVLGILIVVNGIVSIALLFIDQNTYYVDENYTANCLDVNIYIELALLTVVSSMLVDGGIVSFLTALIVTREDSDNDAPTVILSLMPLIVMMTIFVTCYFMIHDCITFINYIGTFLTFPTIIIYSILTLVKIFTVVIYVYNNKNKNNIEIFSVENINDGGILSIENSV